MTSRSGSRATPQGPSFDLDRGPLPYQLAIKDRALASADEGITISDLRRPDNPLVYVNRGFTDMTGYTREESIGRNCRYLQGAATDPAAVEEIRSAIEARRACVVELLNYRRDGSAFWNRLSLTPVLDESGEATHYIGVQTDVTREREAEGALREANERLAVVNRGMQRDLDAAAAIQRSLLPDRSPVTDGMDFAWRLDPCEELAGDTLNVLPLGDGRLGIYVLDVSGHGVPAALLSVSLHHWLSPDPDRSVLRTSGQRSSSGPRNLTPDQVASQLNREFPMDHETGQYFTLIYGVLDLASREYSYVTAGHPPPIHLPARGRARQLSAQGVAIGFFPDSAYRTCVVKLQPGDRLYLFSDGLPESTDPDGEFFDVERVVAAVEGHRSLDLELSVNAVVDAARRWRGGLPPDDDLTLFGLEVG